MDALMPSSRLNIALRLLRKFRLAVIFPCIPRIEILAIDAILILFRAASAAGVSMHEGVGGSRGDEHTLPPMLALVGWSVLLGLCIQIPLIHQG